MGVGPLSHREIESWSRLMQISPPVSPSEVDVLRRLDRECRAYHNAKNDTPKQSIGAALQEIKEAHVAEKIKTTAPVRKRQKK